MKKKRKWWKTVDTAQQMVATTLLEINLKLQTQTQVTVKWKIWDKREHFDIATCRFHFSHIHDRQHILQPTHFIFLLVRRMIYSGLCLISFLGCSSAFVPSSTPRSSRSALSMVVASKSSYTITLLPGDGIGPEILQATVPVLDAIAEKNGF